MFLTLVRKEILSHILTLRFAVTFVLIVLFLFSGFYVSVIEFRQNVNDYHATERLAKFNTEQLLKEEDPERRMGRLFWMEGVTATVPVPPLSAVSQGLSGVWPAAINVSMMGANNLGKSLQGNPLSRVFPVPDYVYIVNAILSLLAILFIFDGVCGEKEAGTLRLMLSFSVPRHLVLLSKWLGGYVVLLAPFLIGTLGGLGYAWIKGALLLNGQTLMILFLITIIAALYVSVFFTLGLFVSAATKKAFTSLFLCLFLWVVAILIIPNLAPVMGRILAPTPSPRKIEAEKEAVSREIELRMDRIYWATEGSSVSGDELDREMGKLREEGASRRNRWDRFLEQAQLSQTRISEVLGRLSPSSSWIFSAYSLIKAGPAAYRNITDGRNRLKKDLEDQWQGIEQHWRRYQKPPELKPEELPNLKIQFYDTNRAVAGALNDVLLLIIFNALFFMAAFMFFLRYDVR